MSALSTRLAALSPDKLARARRGIEKESLRVAADGALALTPHPAGLGSALTHPHITTDFSESQLELITGVHEAPDACLQELAHIHQVVYRHIGGELLWASSMPCRLPPDDAIPLGQYGRSNIARMKTVYRRGLSHRYGRRMQTISGIHYNFSLPGVATPEYFALIRNFRRHSWLPLYLFGASPAVCASFVAGRKHELKELAPGTLHLPHATSLRMGRLGYQSDAQAALCVSYNDFDNYAASLESALTTPFPAYEEIGIRDGSGEDAQYRQLSTSLLQIENEFYSTIRPKRRIRHGERPLHALRERGVEYVEVRLMDLDPFETVGISAATMRLLDVFLLHCLLTDSPPDSPREIAAIARNQHLVAARGREPGLKLDDCMDPKCRKVPLRDWGRRVLADCEPIAAALDAAHGGGSAYRDALAHGVALLEDPSLTPSARVLSALARNHDNDYVRFALVQSLLHAGHVRGLALPPEVERRFEGLARQSLADQAQIEAADGLDFETYRQRYLAPDTILIAEPRFREDR